MYKAGYLLGRFEQAVSVLPMSLRQAALRLPAEDRLTAEELRLRAGRPPCVVLPGRERELLDRAVTGSDIMSVIEIATKASAHWALSNVCSGFITIEGGHRLGLCGTAVMKEGDVMNLRDVSSVCLRIAKENRGIAAPLLGQLTKSGVPTDTLIIAPPGGGKTTFLRDLVRLLSDGASGTYTRVALADERGEVAACCAGVPQLDVGSRTDVLTGCPKDKAVMMLLRSMSPGLVAVDEITAPEDLGAMRAAANCGVRLLATAHAEDTRDLLRRPLYKELLESRLFRKAVTITVVHGKREYRVEDLD